jgi:hypothetical protein
MPYPQFSYQPTQYTTSSITLTYNPINLTTASSLYTVPVTNWTYSGNGYYTNGYRTQRVLTSDLSDLYQPIYANTGRDEVWSQWVSGGQTLLSRDQLNVQPDPQVRERRDSARTRARILLAEFLSEEQKDELEHHGRFHVTGSKGRRYCIRAHGQSGNVDLLRPDGSVQATLCAHPGGWVPDGDAWLMQMIELRHDEDQFLRTANVHHGTLAGV